MGGVRQCRIKGLDNISGNAESVLREEQLFCSEGQPSYRVFSCN